MSDSDKKQVETDRRTTITIFEKTKKQLEILRKELGVKSYDELIIKLIESINMCRDIMVKEKVIKALCNDFSETSAAISVWSKLLSKKFDSKDEIATALQYLIPRADDPQIFIVNKEICLAAEHKIRTAATESDQTKIETKAQIKPAETEAATSEKEHKEEAEEGTIEKYVKSVLVPMLKENIGDRKSISMKEFRKIIETLTTLPTNEVLETLVNLNLAEVAGNQIILKLR